MEAAAGFKQAHQHDAEGNFRQRFVENRFAHGAHGGFQIFGAGVGGRPAAFDVRSGDAVVVAVEKGQKVDGQIAFVVFGQAADNAEIQRDIAAIRRDENIARVHVGMEKAVFEHLGEEDFHAVLGEFLQINALFFQAVDVGNGRAVHPFDG